MGLPRDARKTPLGAHTALETTSANRDADRIPVRSRDCAGWERDPSLATGSIHSDAYGSSASHTDRTLRGWPRVHIHRRNSALDELFALKQARSYSPRIAVIVRLFDLAGNAASAHPRMPRI